ncbi:1,4-alpha-glucan-branching enzyme [Trema orientale]|uniref:1,4-alpha-glucan-branching enzyme n=1 Tax=Trema orientale TaxID=63057 RepID=A0A2P5AL66_TREOI|nr:1,4-alpha-glucan-branching enzyme [Trema orientale]
MAAGHNFSPHFLFVVAALTIAATGCLGERSPPTVKGAYWPSSATTTFPPSAINTSLFTHIFYAFLAPSDISHKFEISDSTAVSLSNFTSTLRYADPPAKTLFSVGGGGDDTDYARIASEPSSRRVFIRSSIEVARKFGFDGVDLDWEFPKSPKEMKYLGLLLKEWRHAIKREAQLTSRPPLLLTAAVYFSVDFFLGDNRSFPVAAIRESLDWINVMTYDYHGAWANITGPNAALFDPTSNINTIYGLKSWIQAGMPTDKIVMGLPLYGRTWQLEDPNMNGVGAKAVGPGPGNGSLNYNVVDRLLKNGSTVVYDAATVSVYSVVGSSWIAFDNALTITTKIGFAQALGLRGYFFWALSFDKEWEISTQASRSWVLDNK